MRVITKTTIVNNFIVQWTSTLRDLNNIKNFDTIELLIAYNEKEKIVFSAHRDDYRIYIIYRIEENKSSDSNKNFVIIEKGIIYNLHRTHSIIECTKEDFEKFISDMFIEKFGKSSEDEIEVIASM